MGRLEDSGAEFEATRWSLVAALRGDDEGARGRALEELTRKYWPAVYAYLRRTGLGREAAAEGTQSFFVEVALGRRLFERAEAGRGQLRRLVLRALKNYRIDAARSAEGAWRLRREEVEREESRDGHAGGEETAEEAFDRRWAVAQLEEAVRRCERHFREGGRAGHWALFERRVLRPALGAHEPAPLEECAAAAGFRSAADGAAAVQVVKKRLMALLAEVVSETTLDGESQRAEMAEVVKRLGG